MVEDCTIFHAEEAQNAKYAYPDTLPYDREDNPSVSEKLNTSLGDNRKSSNLQQGLIIILTSCVFTVRLIPCKMMTFILNICLRKFCAGFFSIFFFLHVLLLIESIYFKTATETSNLHQFNLYNTVPLLL